MIPMANKGRWSGCGYGCIGTDSSRPAGDRILVLYCAMYIDRTTGSSKAFQGLWQGTLGSGEAWGIEQTNINNNIYGLSLRTARSCQISSRLPFPISLV